MGWRLNEILYSISYARIHEDPPELTNSVRQAPIPFRTVVLVPVPFERAVHVRTPGHWMNDAATFQLPDSKCRSRFPGRSPM